MVASSNRIFLRAGRVCLIVNLPIEQVVSTHYLSPSLFHIPSAATKGPLYHHCSILFQHLDTSTPRHLDSLLDLIPSAATDGLHAEEVSLSAKFNIIMPRSAKAGNRSSRDTTEKSESHETLSRIILQGDPCNGILQ